MAGHLSNTRRTHTPATGARRLRVLSSKTVYHSGEFKVTSDLVKEPSGIIVRRHLMHHSGSAVILAVDDTVSPLRVLLERQYRYAARGYLLELPAGRVDRGESALAAAKRELTEETGYTARRWKRAFLFYPSPGFLEETMTVFLARGLRPGNAHPEADEQIDHDLVPLPTVLRMIRSGKICDGKTIAGVLWLAQIHDARRIGQE